MGDNVAEEIADATLEAVRHCMIEIDRYLPVLGIFLDMAGDWPEARHGRLFDLAESYEQAATVYQDHLEEVNAYLGDLARWQGDGTAAAVRQALDEYLDETAGMTEVLGAVQQTVHTKALEIESMKWMTLATMAMMVVALIQAVVTIWTGVGGVTGLAAMITARETVRELAKKLVIRLWEESVRAGVRQFTRNLARNVGTSALRGGLGYVKFMGGIKGGIILIQAAEGHDPFTEGWATRFGVEMADTFVAGAIGGPLTFGIRGRVSEAVGFGVGQTVDNLFQYQRDRWLDRAGLADWAKRNHLYSYMSTDNLLDAVTPAALIGEIIGEPGGRRTRPPDRVTPAVDRAALNLFGDGRGAPAPTGSSVPGPVAGPAALASPVAPSPVALPPAAPAVAPGVVPSGTPGSSGAVASSGAGSTSGSVASSGSAATSASHAGVRASAAPAVSAPGPTSTSPDGNAGGSVRAGGVGGGSMSPASSAFPDSSTAAAESQAARSEFGGTGTTPTPTPTSGPGASAPTVGLSETQVPGPSPHAGGTTPTAEPTSGEPGGASGSGGTAPSPDSAPSPDPVASLAAPRSVPDPGPGPDLGGHRPGGFAAGTGGVPDTVDTAPPPNGRQDDGGGRGGPPRWWDWKGRIEQQVSGQYARGVATHFAGASHGSAGAATRLTPEMVQRALDTQPETLNRYGARLRGFIEDHFSRVDETGTRRPLDQAEIAARLEQLRTHPGPLPAVPAAGGLPGTTGDADDSPTDRVPDEPIRRAMPAVRTAAAGDPVAGDAPADVGEPSTEETQSVPVSADRAGDGSTHRTAERTGIPRDHFGAAVPERPGPLGERYVPGVHDTFAGTARAFDATTREIADLRAGEGRLVVRLPEHSSNGEGYRALAAIERCGPADDGRGVEYRTVGTDSRRALDQQLVRGVETFDRQPDGTRLVGDLVIDGRSGGLTVETGVKSLRGRLGRLLADGDPRLEKVGRVDVYLGDGGRLSYSDGIISQATRQGEDLAIATWDPDAHQFVDPEPATGTELPRTPKPEPAPDAESGPAPRHADPAPAPDPAPDPEPAPDPVPVRESAPDPAPVRQPAPDPVPVRESAPDPEPAPRPDLVSNPEAEVPPKSGSDAEAGSSDGPLDAVSIGSRLTDGVPPLPETRQFGPNLLDHIESPQFQRDLERSLSVASGFAVGADPSTHPYGHLVNDGGPEVPGRGNNCLDCALSALSSFYGRPEVSAPRWPDLDASGTRDLVSGEKDGPRRASRWLGDTWIGPPADMPGDYAGRSRAVAEQYQTLHEQIAEAGPGASAMVTAEWLDLADDTGQPVHDGDGNVLIDGAHAFVVVYPDGADGPVWWDPQSGRTWDVPPAEYIDLTHSLWHIRSDHLGVVGESSPAIPQQVDHSAKIEGSQHDRGSGAERRRGAAADRPVVGSQGADKAPYLRVRLVGSDSPVGGGAPQGDARGPGELHHRSERGGDGTPEHPDTDGDRGIQRGSAAGTDPRPTSMASRGNTAGGVPLPRSVRAGGEASNRAAGGAVVDRSDAGPGRGSDEQAVGLRAGDGGGVDVRGAAWAGRPGGSVDGGTNSPGLPGSIADGGGTPPDVRGGDGADGPVTGASSPRSLNFDPRQVEQELFESLEPDHQRALEEAAEAARHRADQVVPKLRAVLAEIDPSGEQVKLVGLEHRAKSAPSLARILAGTLADEEAELDVVLSDVNDMVRFSFQVPFSNYGVTVNKLVEALKRQGYHVAGEGGIKNFWRPGNRYFGANVTLRDSDGRLMEVQFPTETSWRIGKKTHRLYEVVRLDQAAPRTRINALLQILRLNREGGLNERLPSDLDRLPDGRETSLAKWAERRPALWRSYLDDLAKVGRSFGDEVREHGLSVADFPHAEKLGLRDDAGRLRILRAAQGGVRRDIGSNRDAVVDWPTTSGDLARTEATVDLLADDRGDQDLRRPVRGPDDSGGPVDGGADSPGEPGNRAADRGGTPPDVRGRSEPGSVLTGPPSSTEQATDAADEAAVPVRADDDGRHRRNDWPAPADALTVDNARVHLVDKVWGRLTTIFRSDSVDPEQLRREQVEREDYERSVRLAQRRFWKATERDRELQRLREQVAEYAAEEQRAGAHGVAMAAEATKAWTQERSARDHARLVRGKIIPSSPHRPAAESEAERLARYADRQAAEGRRAEDEVRRSVERADVARRQLLQATRDADGITTSEIAEDQRDYWHYTNVLSEASFRMVDERRPGSVVSALTGRDEPPPVWRNRPYDQPYGLRRVLHVDQARLERALADGQGGYQRTPDPTGPWLRLLNAFGIEADPTRTQNCNDVVAAMFDTYVHGRPTVAAPRTFDGYVKGDPEQPYAGERGGPGRMEDLTGGRYQALVGDLSGKPPGETSPRVADGLARLHRQLLDGGHGSFASIITGWRDGGSHAWAAVNHNGQVHFIDPQTARVVTALPSDGGLRYVDGHSGQPVRDPVYDPDQIIAMDGLVVDSAARPMPFDGRPAGAWNERTLTHTYLAEQPPEVRAAAQAETLHRLVHAERTRAAEYTRQAIDARDAERDQATRVETLRQEARSLAEREVAHRERRDAAWAEAIKADQAVERHVAAGRAAEDHRGGTLAQRQTAQLRASWHASAADQIRQDAYRLRTEAYAQEDRRRVVEELWRRADEALRGAEARREAATDAARQAERVAASHQRRAVEAEARHAELADHAADSYHRRAAWHRTEATRHKQRAEEQIRHDPLRHSVELAAHHHRLAEAAQGAGDFYRAIRQRMVRAHQGDAHAAELGRQAEHFRQRASTQERLAVQHEQHRAIAANRACAYETSSQQHRRAATLLADTDPQGAMARRQQAEAHWRTALLLRKQAAGHAGESETARTRAAADRERAEAAERAAEAERRQGAAQRADVDGYQKDAGAWQRELWRRLAQVGGPVDANVPATRRAAMSGST